MQTSGKNLHSTMYLLNPVTQNGDVTNTNRFTFHYVSIKSRRMTARLLDSMNLHSTMYLLNQGVIEPNIDFATFTFHYVSIKSYTDVCQ